MTRLVSLVWLAVTCLDAQPKAQTFALPGAVLLFGTYNELRVVTPEGTHSLTAPSDEGLNKGYFAYPALALHGDAIAWGFATGWRSENRPGDRVRYALGLYSLADRKWKTHGDFDDIGDVALSPDGLRVAFYARQDRKPIFMIFDIATERFTSFPYKRGMRSHPNPSWSPDGTRLAIEIRDPEDPVVAVLDLKTGEMKVVAKGGNPRWSPTGEWIAFYVDRRCLLVRPDGTGVKEAAKGGWGGYFVSGSPVWSPDGTQLLLNESKDDTRIDVVLVDLVSGRKTTKSRRGLPVFGWAPTASESKNPEFRIQNPEGSPDVHRGLIRRTGMTPSCRCVLAGGPRRRLGVSYTHEAHKSCAS